MCVIFLGDVLSRTDGNRDIIIGEWGQVSLIEWIYEGTVGQALRTVALRGGNLRL